MEDGLDRDAVDRGIHEEVALLGLFGQGGLAVHHDHPPVLGAFGDVQAQFAGLDEAHFVGAHQVGGVGPGAFAHGLRSLLVGRAEESSVVALVLDNPANHAQGQGAVGAGLDGHPLPGLGRGLGKPRVHHRVLEVALDDAPGHLGHHVGRAEVGLKGAGPEVDDELRIVGIGLHVGLARGHLVGDVVALLADGGVQVVVHRAEGGVHPALGELLTAMLHTAAKEDKLIVDRTQVGVVGVDEHVQVVLVLLLELLHGHFAVLNLLHVLGHGLAELGVPEFPHVLEAVHVALAEQVAAVDHFVDELLPGNGHPLVLPALAGPLEHGAHPIGVVENLHAGLPLGAQGRFQFGGLGQGRGFGDVGLQVLRAVGIAAHLHQHAIHDVPPHGAGVVAVQAHGVDEMLRGYGIGRRRLGQYAAGLLEHGQVAHEDRGTGRCSRNFQEIPSGDAFLGHVTSPPLRVWATRRCSPPGRAARPGKPSR